MKTLMEYLIEANAASKDSPCRRAKQLIDEINTNFGQYFVTASLSPSLTELIIRPFRQDRKMTVQVRQDRKMTVQVFTEGKFAVDGSSRLMDADEMYGALVGFLGTLNIMVKQHLLVVGDGLPLTRRCF